MFIKIFYPIQFSNTLRRDFMRKLGMIAFAVLLAVALGFSPQPTILTGIYAAVSALCGALTSILPVAAMLMIVIAG